MKKICISALALSLTILSFSQQNVQIQNKKGLNIIPVKGNVAIGVNALPVLSFVGDLFGHIESNQSLWSEKFISNFASNTLFGKYMITDNSAIRAHIRVGQFNINLKNNIDDNGQSDQIHTVVDMLDEKRSVYNFGAGYEWRKGESRLRGIYGGELFYQYRNTSRVYEYGNPIQDGNFAPSSTNWSGVFVAGPNASFARPITDEAGSYHGIGARAFAGIEYFFAPKICIGTEFGMGLTTGRQGDFNRTIEFWDTETNAINTTEIITAGQSNLTIDTDNFNGALYLMFYF